MAYEKTYYFILVPKNSPITKDEIKFKHCYTSREDALEKLTPVFNSLPILDELLELARVEGDLEIQKDYKNGGIDSSYYEEVDYLINIKEICNRRTTLSKIRFET
jgi:hypothetical protein